MSQKAIRPALSGLILVISLFLTACGSVDKPMGKPLPQLTYSNLNPYSVYGGSVEIRESYRQVGGKNAHFVMAPEKLLKDYAINRFYTTGQPRTMVFDIQKASITESVKDSGMMGFVTGADKDVYDLNILIAMHVIRRDGTLQDPFTIALNRQLDVSQNASIAEREIEQFEFLEKAMTDIDKAVTDIVVKRLQ